MANEFPETTARPWTLNVDEYAGNPISGLISIPEIDRCLHDAEWADHEDWQRDLANAELIVTAVNSYDALREAVEAALVHFEIRQSLVKRVDAPVDEKELALIDQLRAALHSQPQGQERRLFLPQSVCSDRSCPLHGDYPNTCVTNPVCSQAYPQPEETK